MKSEYQKPTTYYVGMGEEPEDVPLAAAESKKEKLDRFSRENNKRLINARRTGNKLKW